MFTNCSNFGKTSYETVLLLKILANIRHFVVETLLLSRARINYFERPCLMKDARLNFTGDLRAWLKVFLNNLFKTFQMLQNVTVTIHFLKAIF